MIEDAPQQPGTLKALLLELDSPGALITAAEQVRDAGYRKWDTHSPFPVHGIDQAMGIRPTRLPWLVFAFGVLGCIGGLVLQWWTNATSANLFDWVPTFVQGYNYVVSGKPEFSLPANIPVIFETTVLAAALAAVIGMLAMNNLPLHHNALFTSDRFRRATSDRFFLAIDAADAKFDESATRAFMSSLGGTAVEEIREPDTPAKFPRVFVITGLVLVCLALFPPLIVAKARVSKSREPRIHIIQDMDNQERYKAQATHPLFADGRASRPQVAGTIARGDWPQDPHLHDGMVHGEHAATYPDMIEVDADFVRRGQEGFNIYCAPCHGLGGAGDGIISQRAIDLATPGWVVPTSLHDERVVEYAHGRIYRSIRDGYNSMPPYGDQIPVEDRWAIVAYVRALQISQGVPRDAVPRNLWPEER